MLYDCGAMKSPDSFCSFFKKSNQGNVIGLACFDRDMVHSMGFKKLRKPRLIPVPILTNCVPYPFKRSVYPDYLIRFRVSKLDNSHVRQFSFSRVYNLDCDDVMLAIGRS
jgi:hypothetical protein